MSSHSVTVDIKNVSVIVDIIMSHSVIVEIKMSHS